jgi:ABC-type multidrug transport system fused ATPase/permease subunit
MTTEATDAAAASPSTAHLLWRLTGLVWRFRWSSLRVLVLNVGLVALNLGGLSSTGLGIDVLRHAMLPDAPPVLWPGGWSPPTSWSPRLTIAFVAGLVLAFAAATAVLKYLTAVASAHLSQQLLIRLRTDVYAKLQRLSFRFYDDHDSSSLIGRVAGDVQAVRSFVDGVVLKVLTVALSLAVYMVYMLSLHVPLTLACLATSPLLWVGAVWFSRQVRPLYLRSSELSDRLIAALVESVHGISVIKGFAREPETMSRFAAANKELQDQKKDIFRRLSFYQPLMGLLTQVNQLVLIGYGGYLVIRGELPLGTGLFVFANLIQEFAAQVGQIVNIANSIQASLTAGERVFEVLDAPVQVDDVPHARPLPRAQGRIAFEHVTFSYRPGLPVLQDVSLEIAAGERVGIVGETGSGKTTLLALMARFYDVEAGRVLVDGSDVRELRLHDLRRNLGLVFQESFLFSNTVAANIAFGRPEATLDDVRHAAKLAAAAEFVDELPLRYENLVGEHGVNLSGGQRQRLAIARALLLDPPILLLDDATAAVDPETEHEIQTAIEQAQQGRTTVLVSSRVAALQHTDRIYVLKRGRVVEFGSPRELWDRHGEYWRLARQQLSEEFDTVTGALP